MKKLTILSLIFFFALIANLSVEAQEIEVTNDRVYMRSLNSIGTLFFYPEGNLCLATGNSDAFTINVNNANARGIIIRNNWASPAAFEVYGSGLVKANNVVLTSDADEKEQIEALGSQIEKIKKLKAVTYQWKNKEANGYKTNYGLLAQDLEKVYPDMVFRSDTGGLGIYYIELIPVMLEAMQEQQAIIEKQEKQLLDIEQRLAQLEKKSK